jgi:hypothetical protein
MSHEYCNRSNTQWYDDAYNDHSIYDDRTDMYNPRDDRIPGSNTQWYDDAYNDHSIYDDRTDMYDPRGDRIPGSNTQW